MESCLNHHRRRILQGKAPKAVAHPVLALWPAVKPTGPRNPNAAGGPVRTGGGEGSNKHAKIKPVTGSPNTRKISPAGADHIGKSVGTHVMTSGGNALGGDVDGGMRGTQETRRGSEPLVQSTPRAAARMGNDVATDVGKGGPGTGRVVHRSGSQGTWGNPAQGSPMQPTGPGGPGSFGFKGSR